MEKIKKDYNLKFLSVFLAFMFSIEVCAYGRNLSYLRPPIGIWVRAEEMQGKFGAEEKDLIIRLSSDDTKIIDVALLGLDRIPDAEQVKNIIEQVFRNRGLILKRSDFNEEKGAIQIFSIDNSELIGERPCSISLKERIITFDFVSLELSKSALSNFTRHRLMPMLHRWMTAEDFFKQFSGYEIKVDDSNFQGARAWWRSRFPIKITGLRDNRVINNINDINDSGELYKITGTFLSWEDSFKYGFRTTEGIKHMPRGKWAYLAHTGTVDLHPRLLVSLYEDLENSRREIFCCLKITPDRPGMWGGPAGLMLNIQDDGEVLYAGHIRSPGNEVSPLEEQDEKLNAIKGRMRTRGEIDFTPPKGKEQPIEIDITGAKIEGVCIDDARLKRFLNSNYYLTNFSLLMAIALRYKLPIVFVSRVSNAAGYDALYRKVERILKEYERAMFMELGYMDHFNKISFLKIGVNNENELVTAILKQVVPQPESALPSFREHLPTALQTEL